MKRKVFVSSVIEGMEEHREAVVKCLQQSKEFTPVYSEPLPASPASPADVLLDLVRNAGAYVGLFGTRYGYVPPFNNPESLSVTELEYREARDNHVPVFIFDQRDVNKESALAECLTRMKDWSTGHYINKFKTSEELTKQVLKSLKTYFIYSEQFNNLPAIKSLVRHTKHVLPREKIRRTVAPLESYREDALSFLGDVHPTLTSVLQSSGSKQIVLLAHAGMGKTIELLHCFLTCPEPHRHEVVPLYVDMSTYVEGPIEDYIRESLSIDRDVWDFQDKSMLFLFDEFDKVKNKVDAAKQITQFSHKHPQSSVVVACRTNFYSGQFENFTKYILEPISHSALMDHLDKVIRGRADEFGDKLVRMGLQDLLYHPFYLTHLLTLFKSQSTLPKGRSAVLKEILLFLLSKDYSKFTASDNLREVFSPDSLFDELARLAVIMETLERNYVSETELHDVIQESQKLKCIKKLSLLKKSFREDADYYHFSHNTFQEYLAASYLAEKPFATLRRFLIRPTKESHLNMAIAAVRRILMDSEISVFGIRIDKFVHHLLDQLEQFHRTRVKPSWKNTVAFLCSLRKKTDLQAYLMEHDPEFLMGVEPDHLVLPDPGELVIEIYEQYSKSGASLPFGIQDLGRLSQSPKVYEHLMRDITNSRAFARRANALRLLRFWEGRTSPQLRPALVTMIQDAMTPPPLVYKACIVLADLKLVRQEDLDKAVLLLESATDDHVLAGIYYLLASWNKTDQYVGILCKGLQDRSFEVNAPAQLADITMHIEAALSKITTTASISQVLNHCRKSHDPWARRVLENALRAASKVFKTDPVMYEDMKTLALTAAQNYDKDFLKRTKDFFSNTLTTDRLLSEVYKTSRFEQGATLLYGMFATETFIDHLIAEYQASRITANEFQEVIFHFEQTPDTGDSLLTRIQNKTGKFYQRPAIDWDEHEKERDSRMMRYLFSKPDFLAEVENILHSVGKREITFEDLSAVHFLYDNTVQLRFDDYVHRKVLHAIPQGASIPVKNILQSFSARDWTQFIVKEIYDLHVFEKDTIELSDEQKHVITTFCLSQLKNVDFTNAMFEDSPGQFRNTGIPVLLWHYLRHLQLEYPEEVLLDLTEFDYIEGSQFLGFTYLLDFLPLDKVQQRVLQNLKKGFRVTIILENHIEFCKTHQVIAALPYLRDIASERTRDPKIRRKAVEALASLPGGLDTLRSSFFKLEGEVQIRAAECIQEQANEVPPEFIDVLRKYSNSKTYSDKRQAAILLVQNHDLDTIHALITDIKTSKAFVSDHFDPHPLQFVHTIKALPTLVTLLDYERQQEIKEDRFASLFGTLRKVFLTLADESERNYRKIQKALKPLIQAEISRPNRYNYLCELSNALQQAHDATDPPRLSDAIQLVNST